MNSNGESPINSAEATKIGELILEYTGGREPDEAARDCFAARLASLSSDAAAVHPRSLTADRQNAGGFYVTADTGSSNWLLHFVSAAAAVRDSWPGSVSVGRARSAGHELVVNAIPFRSTDRETIVRFVEQVDPAFLPRPQRAAAAIAAGNRHPEISLPAVFEGFRTLLQTTGQNLASTVQLSATREMTTDDAIAARDGENPTAAGHTRVSIRHLYHAGLWAAIRAGWRHGYNAEADHVIITGNTPDEIARSIEAGKEAIRHAEGFTKFTTDTSRLFDLRADERHPSPYSASEIESRAGQVIPAEVLRWAESEFTNRSFDTANQRYSFTREEVRRLCVKFGPSLLLNEELYDYIVSRKSAAGGSGQFDFEPSLDEADTLTTPEELIFYMHWLKARGRSAQLVPPNLGFKKRQAYPESQERLQKYAEHKMWLELLPRVAGQYGGDALKELSARIAELAAVARLFDGTLSIHSGSGKQPAVLRGIGRSTNGRWNYKISGELQLQLFDVLYEQPSSSPWRQLYDRMVARCNDFAARGAFGEESELATRYEGSCLGDAHGGRTDGNLFLVFWLGNLVGSRDNDAPDGDTRYFKDKLDEIPSDLRREVQRRNAAYIVWLANQLRDSA